MLSFRHAWGFGRAVSPSRRSFGDLWLEDLLDDPVHCVVTTGHVFKEQLLDHSTVDFLNRTDGQSYSNGPAMLKEG